MNGIPPWMRRLHRDVRDYWPLWLIVAASVILRIIEIGRVPGLLGDEAWYGVQVQRFLAGTGGELRTPTGNLIGLIQLGSLTLLHALFEPSVMLLRLPSLVSSLAAIGLAYAIGRRFFGAATAMAFMVLMAALPVNIAYARLSWDPSHAALLVLAATYATFARRRLLGALFFAIALTNHPAAVFVAPFLSLAYLGSEFDQGPARSALAKTIIYSTILLLAVLFSFRISPSAGSFLDPTKMIARLLDYTQWREFSLGYVRLLSGDSIYIFMAGRGFGEWRPWVDAATALVVLIVIVSGISLARRDRRVGGMVFGWLSCLLLLFVIAGPIAVRPVSERYAIATVATGLVTMSVIIGALLSSPRQRALLQVGLAAMALPLLIGFCAFYLGPLLRGQNRPNVVYWVGVPELNRRAADRILAINGRANATILAEDWWIYWPVAYRLADDRFVGVDTPAAASLNNMPTGRSYWISYRDSALDRRLAHHAGFRSVGTVETPDQSQALHVWLRDCALRTRRGMNAVCDDRRPAKLPKAPPAAERNNSSAKRV